MGEYYKTQQQLQAERRKKQKEDNASAVVVGLLIAGAITYGVYALKRARQTAVSGPQTSLFDFMHPDIDEAWRAMEEYQQSLFRRSRIQPPGYGIVSDERTGDEYYEGTVFEFYKQAWPHPMEYLREVTGEKLAHLSDISFAEMQKAKKFGYTLYIYQDGELVNTWNE